MAPTAADTARNRLEAVLEDVDDENVSFHVRTALQYLESTGTER
ncbi:MAG: hypothetical protein ABEJ76_09740 [Halanaeroarchaeum sp.]